MDSNINSITEFKQIIGRGTRLLPDYGKNFFTIMDFRNASRLFADPKFDGEPEVVYEVKPDSEIELRELGYSETETEGTQETEENFADARKENGEQTISGSDEPEEPKKYYVGDVEVKILSERVQYLDKDGKLITESLIDYTRKNILAQYARLDTFLHKWTEAQKKQAIIDELKEEGVLLEAIREETGMYDKDDFDLICHLAYDKKPLTKAERANHVKKRHYLYKYSELGRKVLEALLDKYANDGIKEIEDTKVLQLQEFRGLGSPMKLVKEFGGKEGYLKAVHELENEIFSVG